MSLGLRPHFIPRPASAEAPVLPQPTASREGFARPIPVRGYQQEALLLQPGDSIFLNLHNAIAGITVRLQILLADLFGREAIEVLNVASPASDRTLVSNFFPILDHRYLVGLATVGESLDDQPGSTRAQIGITRRGQEARDTIRILTQDYLFGFNAPAWPGGRVLAPQEGPGRLRSILGTDPAAGVEISETVPTNARWRVGALLFTLVTDATVATRQVQLVLDDGASVFYRVLANATQLASVTGRYSAGPGHALVTAADSQLQIPLPVPVLLDEGARIRTITSSLQAGDNFSAPQMLVEEWIPT